MCHKLQTQACFGWPDKNNEHFRSVWHDCDYAFVDTCIPALNPWEGEGLPLENDGILFASLRGRNCCFWS